MVLQNFLPCALGSRREGLQRVVQPRLSSLSYSQLKGNFPKSLGFAVQALRPYHRMLKLPFITRSTLCTDECTWVITWVMSVACTGLEAPGGQGPPSSYSSLYPGTWHRARNTEGLKATWNEWSLGRNQLSWGHRCPLGGAESSLWNQPQDMLMWMFPGHPANWGK